MKEYPYPFRVMPNTKNISDCKYRIKFKALKHCYVKGIEIENSPTPSYKKVNYDEDPGVPRYTYLMQPVYYLYLEEIETGKCYAFQKDTYNSTKKAFDDFINQAKSMSQ